MTRLAAVAAIVAGIAIAVAPFAFSLAGNLNGGERVTDRFRTTMSTEGLETLRSRYGTVVRMGDDFFRRTLPDVRRQLGESPAEFRADLRRRYPAIVEAQREVPPVVAIVGPNLPGVLGLHDDFQKVDSLPFLGLPLSAIPWIMIAIGVVVAGIGTVVLLRPGRLGAGVIALAGVALIAVPLSVSAFDKVDAAVNVDRVGSFAFAPDVASAALATTQRLDRLVAEVNSKFLPETAARLNVSPARLNAQIARRYPAVARGLAQWPTIRPSSYELTRNQVASVTDFENLHGIDFRAIPWTVIGPGILLLLVGAISLVQRQGRRT